MRLTIQKRQELANGKARFFVACRSLILSPAEVEQLQRYGPGHLDRFFDDLAQVRAGQGIERTFDDVLAANKYIADIHALCRETEEYWAESDAFQGNADYPPVNP
jgi:hypothetical protein